MSPTLGTVGMRARAEGLCRGLFIKVEADGREILRVSGLVAICLPGSLLNVTRDHGLESYERVDS